jgi:hypothetical protein
MRGNAVVYEEDLYLWTEEQERLLRSGEFSAIDAANIAEEIESMGRSDRRIFFTSNRRRSEEAWVSTPWPGLTWLDQA